MERSIDELLSDEPVETVEATEPQEPEQTPEPEADADDRPRGPDGKFVPKQTGVEEPQAEPVEAGPPPADQLPKDVYEPLKAVRNENRELKAQIEALRQQFEQAKAAPVAEQPVDFWENPEAFMAKQLEAATAQAVQRIQQQQTMERINASETAAKGKYADYDDAFRAFQQAASSNPSLIQQMTSAADPADFAYKTGKRSMDLEKLGSLDELIASERAKWEAETKAAMPAATLPSTTATDGSVGSRGAVNWTPPSIDNLLG